MQNETIFKKKNFQTLFFFKMLSTLFEITKKCHIWISCPFLFFGYLLIIIVKNRFVRRTFVLSVKMILFFDFQTLCHFLKLLTLPIISFENLFEIIAISYFLLRRSSKKCYEYVLLKNVSYYLTNNLNFTLAKVWEIVGFAS